MKVAYIIETEKSVANALAALQAAIAKNQYGVMHIHDLRATLQKKGHDLGTDCHVLEVCNPRQAVNVLREDISMNMALPCRISVYQEGGKTKIGTILPTTILGMMSDSPALGGVAGQVEQDLKRIIDEAK